MKLVELDSKKFDEVANREPIANYVQESNYVKNIEDYEVKYLGFTDDEKLFSASGLFLLKRGTFFHKDGVAICNNGFLANYYDTDLIKQFTLELVLYFKKYYVNTLLITPPIEYLSKNGNNDLLIKHLEDIGYKKIDDHFIYCKKIDKDNLKTEEFEDFYLEVVNNENEINILIDTNKTLQALNDSIEQCNDYLSRHKDDYKLFDEIAVKQETITKKQNYIALLQTLNTNKLAYANYDIYKEGLVLKKMNYNPKFDFISLYDLLKNNLYRFAIDNKQNYVFSDSKFDDATKIDFIGKFEYKF